MNHSHHVTIIGLGLIGKALKAKLDATSEWQVSRVIEPGAVFDGAGAKVGVFDPTSLSGLDALLTEAMPSVVFLSIPTIDGGDIAFRYLTHFAEKNIPVVTCEKGALSHRHAELAPLLSKIGHSATVGGGTRLLPYLKERLSGRRDVVVHAIVNGTLNYIFDEVARGGRAYGEAVEEAQRLGYAEPGTNDYLEVTNGEMKDTVMKSVILFNVCLNPTTPLSADQITVHLLSQNDLSRLVKEGAHRRYIVSFLPADSEEEEDVIGGFRHTQDGWKIIAGFRRIDTDPVFADWLPRGVNNSILSYEGAYGEDGIFMLTGPGAGPKPTSAAMINDAKLLLHL